LRIAVLRLPTSSRLRREIFARSIRDNAHAYARRDYDVFLLGFDPEIVIDTGDAFPESNVYHGLEGARRFLAMLEEVWGDYRIERPDRSLHRTSGGCRSRGAAGRRTRRKRDRVRLRDRRRSRPDALSKLAWRGPSLPQIAQMRQRVSFDGDAEIAVLQDSGHWPFADDPDAVGRLVEPFLRRTVSGDRAAVTA